MKKNLFLLLLGFNSLVYAQEFTDLKGDYFGQTPPGDIPVVFAPGIISRTDRSELQIAFSPDGNECYFYADGSNGVGIYYTERVNNTWTEQVEAPFSINRTATDPFFSVDGKRLYFTYVNDDWSGRDIWFVEHTSEGWGEPQRLPSPINSDFGDMGYTETADGVAYIQSDRDGDWDIWCISRLSDQSLQAENLGPIVNSTQMDISPCIAPDRSYLIFSSTRPGGYSIQDLYICFNKGNNEWTVPVNMNSSGAKINIARYNQICPSLSPDGKFLFFCNHAQSSDTIDIYWVSTKVIHDIKKTILPDPNGSIGNTSTGQRFSSIQCAIDYANPNETIIIEPNIYEENVTLDKDIILRSLDPNNPIYIGGTIILGSADSPVITLQENSAACEIAGLTIRTGSIGIKGTATNATIRNCRIMDNTTHGMELSRESNPSLKHCLITANGQTGITMLRNPSRNSLSCAPLIENCVIVRNGSENIVGGEPVIIDSLVIDN